MLSFLRRVLTDRQDQHQGWKKAFFISSRKPVYVGGEMRRAEEELGVPVVYNVGYKPEFSGISNVWGNSHQLYRPYCDQRLL